jgi:hypothetical protein
MFGLLGHVALTFCERTNEHWLLNESEAVYGVAISPRMWDGGPAFFCG